MGNLTHVELLPAGGGLHDGGVDAELVAGAKDGDLHVPVGRAYKQMENILKNCEFHFDKTRTYV